MDKKLARKKGLAARAVLTKEQRDEKSVKIFEQLKPYLEKAEKTGCYVSMRDEAETYSVISWCFAHDRKVAVPLTSGNMLIFRYISSFDDLERGNFGVMEPVRGETAEPEELDLMIVPLSAFDAQGHRTGYGKGYYDSILGRCSVKAGIAFAEQQVDEIETDPWDVDLDFVIKA